MRKPAAKRTRSKVVADDYLELVKQFPLRPIRSGADYDTATTMLDRLVIRDEASLSDGERDYLDALTTFVEQYDDEHYPIEVTAEPLVLLRELMRHRGTTVTELGKLFGSKGVASEVLSGKRPLTLKRIQKLAGYFRVEPAVFVPEASKAAGR